jgi:hypothetical protein
MLIFNLVGYSQTELSAGDIAILQMNSDPVTQVTKFLALTPMESGTTISFTDNGWKSDDTFRTGEGIDIWTAGSNIKAGDIIEFTFVNVSLSTSGDQLLAYQIQGGSEVFLSAVNNEGVAVWQTSATSDNTSALPIGLTNNTNAVAINERDNIKYNGVSADRKGTISHILINICDDTKWKRSNSNVQNFTRTFTSLIKWINAWSGTGDPSGYFNTSLRRSFDTSTDGVFTANELEVRGTRTMTINSGDLITINNSIDNIGAIFLEDNASLVQVISDAPNIGTGYTVERETTSLTSQGIYTYWSSPLVSSTLIESVATHLYYSFNGATQNWFSETSGSFMSPGVGYAATGPSLGSYPLQHTAAFTGSAFNNGDIFVTLGYSSDGDNTNDANLIGNPYPSAIDADAFLTANTNLGGTLYFWTHNSDDTLGDNSVVDYVYWNGMGGLGSCTGCTAPDGNIASGQGFFSQAIASGNITFTNEMRISTSGDNDLFYKTTAKKRPNEKDRIWLNVTSGVKFSQMLFGYHPNATLGKDRLYDAERSIGGQGLSLNSILEDKSYAIQGKNIFMGYEELALSIDSDATGEHIIEIDHLEGVFNKVPLVIKDNTMDIEHDLSKGAYSFNIDISGEYTDRFVLKIGEKENVEEETSYVRIYVKNKFLKIKSKVIVKGVRIYDIHGKEIFRTNKSAKRYSMKLKKLSNLKIIIVHLQLKTGEILKKKVLVEN